MVKKHTVLRVVSILVASAFCVLSAGAVFAGEKQLVLGGDLFGVDLDLDGVLVSEICEFVSNGQAMCPARDAGVEAGDVIITAGDVHTDDLIRLTEAVALSDGATLTLGILRSTEQKTLEITPVKNDENGAFQLGILAKERLSGVGTVTYYDAENGTFGGLGHGVCDASCDTPLSVEGGAVYSAHLKRVVRGEVGAPGELCASFDQGARGAVEKNTSRGVFGTLQAPALQNTVEVAGASRVHAGAAQVYCTVGNEGAKFYDVEISDVKHDGAKTKNFIVTVTDEELIRTTGGIVQGMSGSPILQDGKLVGALTHVLVRHPTRGYGIFIENMLSA